MKRRKAREYALQLLFQSDITEKGIDENTLKEFWLDKKEREDVISFTERLVKGTLENIDVIDGKLREIVENWDLSRIAAVDRSILRFASYEILYMDDIPSAVTINEAIEIAKKFSSKESASFLNGILDKLAKQVGKP
jgi:N utilization substance protein B